MTKDNISYLKRLQRFKKIGQPFISFLDKIRLLPFLIPIINFVLKLLGIKKRFQKDLNYRLIGKIFNNEIVKYDPMSNKKTVVIPFFSGGNNLFFLINLILVKRLQRKGYQAIFLVCDKSLPICNNERINKTRIEDKHLCKICFDPFDFIKKSTGASIENLSFYKNSSRIDYEQLIDQLNTLNDCENFSFDGINFGKIAKKSVMRYFLIGELSNKVEHIKVYKKFIHTLASFHNSWLNFLNKNNIKPNLLLIYNGSLSFETYLRKICKDQNINFITHETYIGTNSWVYKFNDEVMKLRWMNEWEKYRSNPLNELNEQKVHEFMKQLRGGEHMYAKLNKELPLDDRLINKSFVVLFTNLSFDTTVLGRDTIFNSMNEWINNVIEFWMKIETKQILVIRIHPGEKKLLSASSDFVGEKIKHKINGKSNIILFDADDVVDSYSLIENMEFSLIYSSTIGLEIAYYKKYSLIASDAFYMDIGFTENPSSKEDYIAKLENWLRYPPKNKKLQYEDVLKFIYFIYFKQVKYLKGLKMDHKLQSNFFNFKNSNEFENLNSDIFLELESELETL
jgi:hypothetical protein